MSGKRMKRTRPSRPRDERAQKILKALLADNGWVAEDIARESERGSKPSRAVSERTVYRVTQQGAVPVEPIQFVIAAVFRTDYEVGAGRRHLLPSHIWGMVPLPAPYDHLNVMFQEQRMAVAA